MARPVTSSTGLFSGRPSTASLKLLTGSREPCRVVAVASVDINAGGLLTIDGVALVAGDRVLLSAQTDPAENGIYTAAVGAWYRATDARHPRAISTGTQVRIQQGNDHALETWEFRTYLPAVGADPISVVEYTVAVSYDGQTIYSQTGLAGTVDALEVTTDNMPAPSATPRYVMITPSGNNTTAATIKFDGGAVLDLKSNVGGALGADDLQARPTLLRVTSTDARIVTPW